MWHISFMGNKKNQEFKNDVLPKNSKKITNNSFWINGKFFSFLAIRFLLSSYLLYCSFYIKRAILITLQLKQVTLNLNLEIMYPISFRQMKSRFTQVKDSANCLDSKNTN